MGGSKYEMRALEAESDFRPKVSAGRNGVRDPQTSSTGEGSMALTEPLRRSADCLPGSTTADSVRGPAEDGTSESASTIAFTLSGRREKTFTVQLGFSRIARSSSSEWISASRTPKSGASPLGIPQKTAAFGSSFRIAGKCLAKSGSWKNTAAPSATAALTLSGASTRRSQGVRSGKTKVWIETGFPPRSPVVEMPSTSPSKKLTITRSREVRTVTLSPSRRYVHESAEYSWNA